MRRNWLAIRSAASSLGYTLAHRRITVACGELKHHLYATHRQLLTVTGVLPFSTTVLGTRRMSDDPSTWWSFTTKQSVKLVLAYMPVKPRAVVASSLSVRALSELEDTVEKQASEDEDTNERECKRMKRESDSARAVRYVKNDEYSTYPLCKIDVHDIQHVERVLWWLQRTQPKAIQLQHLHELSTDALQRVLVLLFTSVPVLTSCVPLYTDLLEFSIDTDAAYECTAALVEALSKCNSLRKLQLPWCQNFDCLKGLQKLVSLEELDLSSTNVRDFAWLHGSRGLRQLHTLTLRSCKELTATTGVECLLRLAYIDLTASGVNSLAGLEHCVFIRTAIFSKCEGLQEACQLAECRHLEMLDVSETQVADLSFLSGAEKLTRLYLNETPVHDLTPLKNCCALKELRLRWCAGVADVEEVLGAMRSLETLDLGWTSVKRLAFVPQCSSKLKRLDLASCGSLVSIAALETMHALEELDLSNTPVEDFTALTGCQRMKRLNVNNCLNLRSVAVLARMGDLEELILWGTPVEDLGPLRTCTSVRKLIVCKCDSVRNIAAVGAMKALEELNLSSTSIESLEPLLNCNQMKTLELYMCSGVRSIAALRTMHALETLDLSYTSVHDLAPLASCKGIKCLKLYKCTDVQCIDALAEMHALEALDLSYTSVVHTQPLIHCTKMKLLEFSGCTGVDSVAGLARMQDLTELDLSYTSVKSLEPIATCTRMEVLELNSCKALTNVAALANMRALEELTLCDTPVESLAPLQYLIDAGQLIVSGVDEEEASA